MSNHYQTLGVPKDADARTIKKAFRAKAKQHHPDLGGDPEKFKECAAAYEVLSDPVKKSRYDVMGGGDSFLNSVNWAETLRRQRERAKARENVEAELRRKARAQEKQEARKRATRETNRTYYSTLGLTLGALKTILAEMATAAMRDKRDKQRKLPRGLLLKMRPSPDGKTILGVTVVKKDAEPAPMEVKIVGRALYGSDEGYKVDRISDPTNKTYPVRYRITPTGD